MGLKPLDALVARARQCVLDDPYAPFVTFDDLQLDDVARWAVQNDPELSSLVDDEIEFRLSQRQGADA